MAPADLRESRKWRTGAGAGVVWLYHDCKHDLTSAYTGGQSVMLLGFLQSGILAVRIEAQHWKECACGREHFVSSSSALDSGVVFIHRVFIEVDDALDLRTRPVLDLVYVLSQERCHVIVELVPALELALAVSPLGILRVSESRLKQKM